MPSRRRLLLGVGTAGAAALAGCVGSTADSLSEFSPGDDADADWPMPRYDSANTAFSPNAAAPRESVRERWTVEDGMASGPPVVADGTVFQPTSDGLVALDAETGDEQWRFSPGDGAWAGLTAVHDGTVFVGTRGRSGVYALDADSGEELWSAPDDAGGSAGAHLLAGEHVDEPVLYAGGENGELVRLDAATGEATWRTDLFGTVSTFGFRFGQFYAGTRGGEVYAFADTVDGVDAPTEGWRRKVGAAVDALVPDEEGVLVATFGGPLQCLHTGAHAGTTRWSVGADRAGSAPVATTPAFFAAGYDALSAIRENDGEVLWRRDGEFDATAPVAAGDTLYASNGDEVAAFALDGDDGGLLGDGSPSKRWSHPTPASASVGLAVGDGALFAACEGREESDVTLYCLEPAE